MIVTDFNKMSIEELDAINRVCEKEYVIEGGRITGICEVERNERNRK